MNRKDKKEFELMKKELEKTDYKWEFKNINFVYRVEDGKTIISIEPSIKYIEEK